MSEPQQKPGESEASIGDITIEEVLALLGPDANFSRSEVEPHKSDPGEGESHSCIVSKREAIARFEALPLCCLQCQYRTLASALSQEVINALDEVSSFNELKHEFELFKRTKNLFDRFPASWHPNVMIREYLRQDDNKKYWSNSALDEVFDADPELKQFLRYTLFSAPTDAELEMMSREIERYALPDLSAIICPNCEHGYLCVEPSFYENIFIEHFPADYP